MKRHSYNYKGGTISSHGYKLIWVGKEHHLADIRGYAYEHRVVAEKKIGRKLSPTEQVHHKDGNKLNNAPANIEVTTSYRHHRFLHRKKQSRLRKPDEKNQNIFCLCGCGNSFLKYDSSGRPREYVSGHNVVKNEKYCECGCGELVKNKNTRFRLGHKPNRFNHRKIDKPFLIKCACGCNNTLSKFDKYGRERRYIKNHNHRNKNGK